VYVGSSARSPEERFDQHLRGYKSARLVKRFALRLRPDLYEDLAPLRGSKKACAAEKVRARELAECGFVAHCDGTSYGKGKGGWEEWDAERLEPVIEHVEAAAAELAESCFRRPSPLLCAQLLRGELGFWVADYVDQEDPPPAYGRFSHVQLDALHAHLRTLDIPTPTVEESRRS
jgi:enoyl-CoA hydratase/carnithine racemase